MRFTSFRPFAGITLNIAIIVLVTVAASASAVAADLPAVTKAPPPDSGLPRLVAGSVNINETSRFLGADALYRQQIGSWAASISVC